jgi:molecular chaperone DnaK
LRRTGQDLRIAVVDFGGGTLDVTIMEFGKGVFEVKAVTSSRSSRGI